MRAWAPVSATLAPLALVGGWSVAATRQPAGYDATRDTISALAAHDAQDPWLMTAALVVVGGCHLATALALTEADRAGRAVLAFGGVATVLVAAFPQPSPGHFPAATASFAALAAWPALSALPSRRAGLLASGGLAVLLGWLGLELGDGDLLGLSERVAAGAQALWPLAAVLALRARARRA